jgi:quercetin dioxygenase-like cupin family protein
MELTKLRYAIALAGVVSFGAVFSLNAQTTEYVPKVVVDSLYEDALADVDGKTVIVKHFTVPAGFVGGKHYHPGNVFVYVLEGAIDVETENGVLTVGAGELYPEVPGMEMLGKNSSTTAPAKFVVFQVGETGKPMMVKVE